MNPPLFAVLSSYRLITLFLIICFAAFLIGTSTGIYHADSGRDEPVAVGMFLDGAFPSLDPNASLNWKIVDAFPNLSFHNPIYMLQEPGTDYLWVAEHAGRSKMKPSIRSKTKAITLSTTLATDNKICQ